MNSIDNYLCLCLDHLSEPVFLFRLDEESCAYANSSFLRLLGLQAADGLKDFWPAVGRVNLDEEVISTTFTGSDGGALQVCLAVDELEDGLLMARVLADSAKDSGLSSFHAQRLETLGMLAGGIAHDFNNILAGILGHTTYLKTILPATGSHEESLVAIEDGARKASTMTQQILNFSKLDTEEKPLVLDLSDLVVSTCKLLKGAVSPGYELLPEVRDSSVMILGVEGKLAQVIVNLVINARDAIDQNGTITVKVATVKQKEDEAKVEELLANYDDISSESLSLEQKLLFA